MEIQEKFLHHIWDQRHLVNDLLAVSGKPVRIIYQGQYNTSSGPDFRNAVLNMDGETLRGDVEIHQKTYDWIAHQHHEDCAYNNTILHVVLEHKGNLDFTVREDATRIEILELRDQIDTDIAKLFAQYSQTPPRQHRGICDYFQLSDPSQFEPLLKAQGWERFSRKCNRYNAELLFNNFDQLLYNGFMEAMGYDKNKLNMLSLAHQFEWNMLSEWHRRGLGHIQLAAIWLNYAGLMHKTNQLLGADIQTQLLGALESQAHTALKGVLQWNLFRIRPANHPVKRIMQAARVVSALLPAGFLDVILHIMEDRADASPQKLVSNIREALFQKPSEDKKEGTIGTSLLMVFIANVVLPVIYLFAQKMNRDSLMESVRSFYEAFHTPGSNYIVNFMHGYLSPVQQKEAGRKHIYQQGLMNLYYRFCHYRLCELCVADKNRSLASL